MRVLLVACLMTLCSASVQSAEPVRVIVDTDMAGDCDDAGAFAVLHALCDRGEAELLAVTVNRGNISRASAAAVDAINTWYGRPDVLIGTDKDGAKTAPKWNRPSPYTPALRDRCPHDVPSDDRMPDAVDVLRRTLAAQPDRSVTLCTLGALSNLEDLLRSGPDGDSDLAGPELVHRKIKQTIIMGGDFTARGYAETNIKLDPPAAVAVVNEWPAPTLWQGFEVGAAIITGTEMQSVPPAHPVRIAYEEHRYKGDPTIKVGKPSHDQAAVLLAIRGPQKISGR